MEPFQICYNADAVRKSDVIGKTAIRESEADAK